MKEKKHLAQKYQKHGYVSDKLNIEAFLNVPREEFVPPKLKERAYDDTPLPLFSTGQTISAPHMCVYILEYLKLNNSMRVLEIGGGSGYQASLIAERLRLADKLNPTATKSKVWSIEIVPELVKFGGENIRRTGYADIISFIEGDGTLGLPEAAPFDRIILTAAGPKIPPPLITQLKPYGQLCMPLGSTWMWQSMIIVSKDESGKLSQKKLSSVRFVPLRGKFGVGNE